METAELGIERYELLDVDAREVVLDDGCRVGLTQLEFGVMRYLVDRDAKVASRTGLESEVWGYDYHGGSNVVDAVVKSLRKKTEWTGVAYRNRPRHRLPPAARLTAPPSRQA